jgi:signal peptidase II
MRAGMGRWLLLAFVLLVVDQVTKYAIASTYVLGETTYVLPFFNLTRVHNTGAAFSFLAGASGWQRWFFTAIGLVATVVIIVMLRRNPGQRLLCFALACILGGALGNVIDRVAFGYVVDFLQFHYAGWYFPSFNVADSAITIGAVSLIGDEILRMRRSRQGSD